jgi:cobalt-zinc-cadmium efflux system outer membrane protein
VVENAMGNQLLLIVCLVAGPAGQPDLRITEQDVLAALDAGNPALAALAARAEELEGDRLAAGLLDNPSLTYASERPDGAPSLAEWALSWAPPLDGRRSLRREAADLGADAARGHLAAQRLAVRAEARQSFAAWSLASRRKHAIAAHHELMTVMAEQLERRAALGEESLLDARRLRLAADESESQLVAAGAELDAAAARMRIWLPGLPAGATPAPPELAPVPSDLDTTARPDLAARRASTLQGDTELRLASRVFEAPELRAGWQRLSAADRTLSGPVWSISLPIPILDHRQADRARARARLAAAEAELSRATAEADTALAAAALTYRALSSDARRLEQNEPGLDSLIGAATAAYRLGEADLTDYLDALRAALAARLRSIDVTEAALAAHRALEVAAGRPLSPGGSR